MINTIKKAIVPATFLAVASFSNPISAATENYAVGFSTVPDIGITEVQALDFGSGLGLSASDNCAMQGNDATSTTYIGDVVMNLSKDTDHAAGADLGDTTCSGNGINGVNSGTPGVYEIAGVPGGEVDINISDVSGTNLNFTANGCAGDYDGAADGDLCTDLASGAATVTIASPGDTVGNGGLGSPVSGTTRLVVGGTVTAVGANPAGTTITESFVIDVTY